MATQEISYLRINRRLRIQRVQVLDKQMEERAEHEAELKKEAEALSETLKGITLEFTLSTGKNGA